MDYNMISQAITTVGFPIVVCLMCFWYISKTTDKHREEVKELNDQHNSEVKNLTEVINNNTVALTSLCEILRGDKNESGN